MKKLLLILLTSFTCSAQYQYKEHKETYFVISSEFDVRNAFYGSKVNAPAYNGVQSLAYRNKELHIQASYEHFKEIGFRSYTLGMGYVINYNRAVQLLAMADLQLIDRNAQWIKRKHQPGAAISIRPEYHFRNFFVYARGQLRYRGDLHKVTPLEGYLGIAIKI